MKPRNFFLSFLFVSFLFVSNFNSLISKSNETTGLSKFSRNIQEKIDEITSLFTDISKQIGKQLKSQLIDPILPENIPVTIKKTLENIDYDESEEIFLGIKNFTIKIEKKGKKKRFGPVDLGISLAMQKPDIDEGYKQGEWFFREVTIGILYKFFIGSDIPAVFKDLGKIGLLSVIFGKFGEFKDPIKTVVTNIRNAFLGLIDQKKLFRNSLKGINKFLLPKGDEVFLIMNIVATNTYLTIPIVNKKAPKIVDFMFAIGRMTASLNKTILWEETLKNVNKVYSNIKTKKDLSRAISSHSKDPQKNYPKILKLIIRFQDVGSRVWIKRLPKFIKNILSKVPFPIPLNFEYLQEWQDRKNLSIGEDLFIINIIRDIREYKGYDIKIIKAKENVFPRVKDDITFTEVKRIFYFLQRLVDELEDSKYKLKSAVILKKIIKDFFRYYSVKGDEFVSRLNYELLDKKIKNLLFKIEKIIDSLKKVEIVKDKKKSFTSVYQVLADKISFLPFYKNDGQDFLSFGLWFMKYYSLEPQPFDLKYLYDDSLLPSHIIIIKLGFLLNRELLIELPKVVNRLKRVKDITITDENEKKEKVGKSTYEKLIKKSKAEYTKSKNSYKVVKKAYETAKGLERSGVVEELKSKMIKAKKDYNSKKKNYIVNKLKFFHRALFVKAFYDEYEQADKLKDWIIESGGKVPKTYDSIYGLKMVYKKVEKDSEKYKEREKELKKYKRNIFDSILKGISVLLFVRSSEGKKIGEKFIKITKQFGLNLKAQLDLFSRKSEKVDEIISDIQDKKEPSSSLLEIELDKIIEEFKLGQEAV